MLNRYLHKKLIFINPSIKNKEEMIKLFVGQASKLGYISDEKSFLNLLENDFKEKISQFIIDHSALPHLQCAEAKTLFSSVFIFENGLELEKDKQKHKVHIVIFIVAPKEDASYLPFFAYVSRLLNKKKFKNELINAHVSEDVFHAVSVQSVKDNAETSFSREKIYQVTLILNVLIDETILSEILIESKLKSIIELHAENFINTNFSKIPFMSCPSRAMIGKDISSKFIIGFSDDPEIADGIYRLLKAEGIDISEPGVGGVYLTETISLFGCLDARVEF
jgi:mannitol/fructose-specific phosphotransferase system IIA component (Ntr-type)